MREKDKKTNIGIILDWVVFIGVPVLFLLIWEMLGNKGVINGSILPKPTRIWHTFISLVQTGKLQKHLSASILRVLAGFLIGSAAGVILGLLMGIFHYFNKAVAVIFGVLRPIPMIGLVPLFILWFGIGETSKVLVIMMGTFWPVLINTQHGIASIDKSYFEIAQLLEKDRLTTLMKIVIPAAMPSIFTGLRLGISAAWKSVVAAEMLAATKGIGYMISNARELAQPDKMFVGLLAIGLIGILIDFVILKLQKKLISWE
jgi:sulfonate transport system permease protein